MNEKNDTLRGLPCADFTAALAGVQPTPGGGGASALTGALAAALCAMAAGVTAQNRRFAERAEALSALVARAQALRARLLALMDEDAAGFAPLAAAYAVPKTDPARAQIVSGASVQACQAPLHMLRCCCEISELLENALVLSSKLLLSDVGCGAELCAAAAGSAAMNVFVNTRTIADAEARRALETETDALLARCVPACRNTAAAVTAHLRA